MGLRILWQSIPMWAPSGYGKQTLLNVKALQTLPEVDFIAISCFSGLDAGMIRYGGVDHLPGSPVKENDIIVARNMSSLEMDLCISMYDIWALPRGFSKMSEPFRWIPSVPVDGSPLAPGNLELANQAWRLIAMSKFGKKVMEDEGLPNVTYIPLMVDTSIYQPRRDKASLKKSLGLDEDTFLVGMVAVNKYLVSDVPVTRKSFSEAIRAFGLFQKKNPEVKAKLYIHSPAYLGPDSTDLPALAKIHGVSFQDIRTIDTYAFKVGIDDESLSHIYSSFDVYFAPSAGEGFNVPLIEAQACGVPVIVNACTAQTENCGSGWKVDPLVPFVPATSTQWWMPDVEGRTCPDCGHHTRGLVDALQDAYEMTQNPKKRDKMAKKAVDFAKNFSVLRVRDIYWKPYLQEVLKDIGKEVTPPKTLWSPRQPMPVADPSTPALRVVK